MNYCVYLRKRKNKPFCKLLNKEITFCRCQECDSKEYKTKNKENSFYKSNGTKKSKNSFYKLNSSQIKKKSTLKEKNSLKSGKMKNKSNKLAKLERNRKSVFTNNMDKSYLCSNKRTDIHEIFMERNRFSVFTNNKDKCMFCSATTNLTWHEIFRGRNRANSIKYGFCLRMCLNCHEEKQEDAFFNNFWHRQAQLYFEKYIGSREEFLRVFRRNYIIKKEEEDN